MWVTLKANIRTNRDSPFSISEKMLAIFGPSPTTAEKLNGISRESAILQKGRRRHGFVCGREHSRFFSITAHAGSFEMEDNADAFPSFLPSEVKNVRDPAARQMARRIQRLPVQTNLSKQPIMSSCVTPKIQNREITPVVLLHGFDSSCLEWRYTYPLLEAVGVEAWAVDLLGWGFTNLEGVSSFNVAAKREHLYKFWRSYIRRPMVLVGASLGGATAIDFAVFHPETVSRLVLIDPSVYSEGTGKMARFPRFIAYAGVSLLKTIPLRLYANRLAFGSISIAALFDSMNVGRLHCLLPYWEAATIDFMLSGGYNVASHINEVQKETLVIWGENDKIISKEYAQKLQRDLQRSQLRYISGCGHIPHVEKPDIVANLITELLKDEQDMCLDNEI